MVRALASKLYLLLVVAVPALAAPVAMPRANKVDRFVFGKLEDAGIPPSELCTDEVFVRRAFLDVIGTLPRPQEARQFIESNAPDKRRVLINRLLERPEYADYWTMKWCDILRVKAEFPSKLWPNAVQAYARWLRDAMRDNMPYDAFARALLTSSGSNFRDPPVNFYRAVARREAPAIAETVALTFLARRVDQWPDEQRRGMEAFFSRVGYKGTAEWKEEIVYFDRISSLTNGAPAGAVFPDGTPATLVPDQDPRAVFADWLVAPGNPYFAKAIVNRLWFWLLGRGIVHEPDDMGPHNPPANPALLDWLAAELERQDYDLKHVFRLILNSNTYQLSSIHNDSNAADDRLASHYLVRRLEAEVLIDAINMITGSQERYSSEIPEPFTFIPPHARSIALTDGSITSPFLDMFGRPPRDTGLASERNNAVTDTQRLHLLNSSHILDKLRRGGGMRRLMRNSRRPPQMVTELYLTVLSRFPTADERETAETYFDSQDLSSRDAALDIAWALLNSKEFLYRH